MNPFSQVLLETTELQTEQSNYQLLSIDLLKPGDLSLPYNPETEKPFLARIQPGELAVLQLPANLDLDRGIVLFGVAPIWVYARLVKQCSKARWVGCYSAPLGKAVVVKSSDAQLQVGDTVEIPIRRRPGMTIAIGGPPDSGKSILSNALRSTLSRYYPELTVFLHRANWDGEGNWSYETKDRQIVQKLVQRGEFRIHELPNAEPLIKAYFEYHAQATANVRTLVDLALVDLGEMPQDQKKPVVEQCTHYIVISSQPDKVQDWHNLFGKHLKPLAVLHTKATPELKLLSNGPYLEQSLDLEGLIKTQQIPDDLLKSIVQAWGEHNRSSFGDGSSAF